MPRGGLLVALLVVGTAGVSACGRTIFQRPRPATADSVYTLALSFLDATRPAPALDSAGKYLDVYLAMPRADRRTEATVMRRLVRDAQQLAKVEAALNQARAAPSPSDTRPAAAEVKAREDEALKEIQRLKDELAKANEELERIRKRLANPKPTLD